jgi:hypothetical protein
MKKNWVEKRGLTSYALCSRTSPTGWVMDEAGWQTCETSWGTNDQAPSLWGFENDEEYLTAETSGPTLVYCLYV